MARILNSDCVNRIHRTRDDSGQNVSEWSNVCIIVGDTLGWWRLAMEVP